MKETAIVKKSAIVNMHAIVNSRLSIVLLAVVAAASPGFAVEVDGIVARVGSTVILRSDVENEQQRMPPQMRATFSETLNQLVDRKLILAAAAESKMTIPLEVFWPWYRRRKLRRKAARYLLYVREAYGVREES